MSIRVMSHVWKHSQAKGGDLLVLLAIADFADDSGTAYPSIATLGLKARLDGRNVQRSIRRLITTGELTLSERQGPHGTNLYMVANCHPANCHPGNMLGGVCDMGPLALAPPNPLKRTVSKNIHSSKGDKLPGDSRTRLERFWAAYPRKEGKGACVRWWRAHGPDDSLLDRMLAKIAEAKQTTKWREQGGKFIPMPATWLNQARWEDEYIQATKPKERIPV